MERIIIDKEIGILERLKSTTLKIALDRVNFWKSRGFVSAELED